MTSALLSVCGLVLLIIGWASMGSSGEMKAKGDKDWRFASIAGLFLMLLALLCWRAV